MVETEIVINEPDVIDDIEIEPEVDSNDLESFKENYSSSGRDVSEDALGDSRLGQHIDELITELRRDEETFHQETGPAESVAGDPAQVDPFDPGEFSLDNAIEPSSTEPAAATSNEASRLDDASVPLIAADSAESAGADEDDASAAIAQAVSEIEAALQRFSQSERLRAKQIVARKEAEVAEQYRRLRNLANKVAKQKAQIQEARKELKEKLELADRLHIEFDGIRQLLDGKLGVLEALEKEDGPGQ